MHKNDGLLFQKPSNPNLGVMVRQRSKKNDDELFIVERIVDRRRNDGKLQYLVKWKDYPASHNTWEDASNIAHCREIVQEFREYRIQEGFDDSEDDSPIPPPPIIAPPKRRRSRKRKSDDSNTQMENMDNQEDSKQSTKTDDITVNRIPNHVVNLSSATEIIGANRINSNKYFCVQFIDGSKYWVSNDECRKHLPQMLLDFYEQCSIFMEENGVLKKETKSAPNVLARKRGQVTTSQPESTSFINKDVQQHHQQQHGNMYRNISRNSADEYTNTSSLMDTQYLDDDNELIIEESSNNLSFTLSPESNINHYRNDNDPFSNTDQFFNSRHS